LSEKIRDLTYKVTAGTSSKKTPPYNRRVSGRKLRPVGKSSAPGQKKKRKRDAEVTCAKGAVLVATTELLALGGDGLKGGGGSPLYMLRVFLQFFDAHSFGEEKKCWGKESPLNLTPSDNACLRKEGGKTPSPKAHPPLPSKAPPARRLYASPSPTRKISSVPTRRAPVFRHGGGEKKHTKPQRKESRNCAVFTVLRHCSRTQAHSACGPSLASPPSNYPFSRVPLERVRPGVTRTKKKKTEGVPGCRMQIKRKNDVHRKAGPQSSTETLDPRRSCSPQRKIGILAELPGNGD